MLNNFTLPLQELLVLRAEWHKGLLLNLPRLMIITVRNKKLIT